MSKGIQPKPLYEVGKIFAEFLGKDWCDDRQEIIDHINEFRERLHIDDRISNIFAHNYYCIELSCFPMECDCVCDCKNYWKGFTLPSSMESIEHAWESNEPLRLHSSWWEGRNGRERHTPGSMSAVNTGMTSPTRRAMIAPSELLLHADSMADHGKMVGIRITDAFGTEKDLTITLSGNDVVSSDEVAFGIVSVALPMLSGTLKLGTGDDYELSTYSRFDDSVPQYPIIKVHSGCRCDRILIEGNQKFSPVCYDMDIVEVGSRLILREAANMMKYGNEGTDTTELNRAQLSENKMWRYLRGAIKNQRGGMVEDGPLVADRQILSCDDLVGYGNRRVQHYGQ